MSGPMREERKVVTALFADVVGSTQLTERLDPEDAREVLGNAVRRMVEAVEAFGGTVKDLAGDGILALFGAPVTHEDDAERAIRLRLLGLWVGATAWWTGRSCSPRRRCAATTCPLRSRRQRPR